MDKGACDDCLKCLFIADACRKNHLKCVQRLVAAGADLNSTKRSAPGEGEFSPLHLAQSNATGVAIIDCLIDAGANVNQKTRWGITPIYMYQQTDIYERTITCKLIINGAIIKPGTGYHRSIRNLFWKFKTMKASIEKLLLCRSCKLDRNIVKHIAKHLWSMRLASLLEKEENK